MKKYLVAAIVLFASSAYAQTPPAPQGDPRIEMYRQLLTEANDRLVGMSAQTQQIQTQATAQSKASQDAASKSAESLAAMTKERDAAKAETAKAQETIADLTKQLAEAKAQEKEPEKP